MIYFRPILWNHLALDMFFPRFLLYLGLASRIQAYPGMEKLLVELKDDLHRRQDDEVDGNDSTELIGDLLTLQEGEFTRVGLIIKDILLGQVTAHTNEVWYNPPAALGTPACAANTCCVWQYISDEMYAAFIQEDGRCNGLARAAVRLGFHVSPPCDPTESRHEHESASNTTQDAGAYSNTTGPYGGADGSIVLAKEDEMARPENRGLEAIVAQMQVWYDKWNPYGASMADLIQFASNVACVTCPLGPRTRTFVGRVDNSTAAPTGNLPSAFMDADTLISLFRNKTIGPKGLVALVGAHTTSVQFHTDLAHAGVPQDSSPGVWDVLFYPQTLETPVEGVFTFASDLALSNGAETGEEWIDFAYQTDAQDDWNEVSALRVLM